MILKRTVFAAFIILLTVAGAAAGPVLERVVIVERHGVRPPTKAPAVLAQYSQKAWPEWSVLPGELTEHGFKAMELMGQALKRHYQNEGLFGAADCPAGVFVWSDSEDQRTRASGDAVLQGMGCNRESEHLLPFATDAVFDPVEYGLCKPDVKKVHPAAEARLAALLTANREVYEKARKTMQTVLTPDGCSKPGQRECVTGEGENVIETDLGEVGLKGPLHTGSTLSENLLLEYSEGLPLSDVGWGKGAEALDEVMVLHNLYSDAIRRLPELASYRSALMGRQIADLIAGRPSHFKGAAPVLAGSKFVLFLGHDGNLASMSGVLGVNWTLPGQPDATAPGTALAFEVWRDGSERFVKVKVFYQKLEETRTLALPPVPHSLALTPPGCKDGICALPVLTGLLENNIARDCVKR